MWEQRRGRNGEQVGVVVVADVFSDVGDFVGDVSDGDGGESVVRDSDSELD